MNTAGSSATTFYFGESKTARHKKAPKGAFLFQEDFPMYYLVVFLTALTGAFLTAGFALAGALGFALITAGFLTAGAFGAAFFAGAFAGVLAFAGALVLTAGLAASTTGATGATGVSTLYGATSTGAAGFASSNPNNDFKNLIMINLLVI